jgi:hypothetical protein
MSDELKEGMSTLKKTILGVVTTAVTAAGVYITTNINKIFGIEDETEAKVEQLIEAQQTQQAAQPAPIILNIENNNTQQQTNSGGGTTIIKETVREVPAAQPAAPVEEKPETPQERMARLKKQREEQNAGK